MFTMLPSLRVSPHAPSDWKTPLAVAGAVTVGYLGAKLLRQALIWAQYTLMPPNIRKYAGEWALVTGGSEGIGKALAAELASHGLHVVLVSRSQQKLDAAAAEISSKHPSAQVKTYAADLTDTSSYSKLLKHLSDNNIHISVLIANAGGIPNPNPKLQPYWEITEFEESQISNLNGQACYNMIRGVLPGMLASGKGAIVCTSSIAHRMTAYMAPYGAEKAKMNALCKALDVELHGTGVTVQAMVLGMVLTPGLTNFIQPKAADATAQAAEAVGVGVAETSQNAQLQPLKPSALRPSAEATAVAMVRCIGRCGPVVTPYWGHALSEWLVFDWWPPELERSIVRAMTRSYRSKVENVQKKRE
eukprot:GHUV01006573.1.p1 GENE.GHUV01006573.1~~GHUV01006573.1.p1  ORF type:complete len:360 (+),score=57.29 GHUV01006573.1:310-1389(+)